MKSPLKCEISINKNNDHAPLYIMYFNARSLPPKFKIDELHALVTVEQPQVICIVESWWHSWQWNFHSGLSGVVSGQKQTGWRCPNVCTWLTSQSQCSQHLL